MKRLSNTPPAPSARGFARVLKDATPRLSVGRGMRGAFLLLGVLVAGGAIAFDLPRVIGVLTSPQEESRGFAGDFCNIGDIDSDGDDDLLVSQLNFVNEEQSRVYLFYGSNSMNNEPAFAFSSDGNGHKVGDAIAYFGHIRGRGSLPVLGLGYYISGESQGVNFYERSGQLSNEPILSISGDLESYPVFRSGYNNKPLDFNGDGHEDLLFVRSGVGIQVCFGGEEFDTLADWSKYAWPWDYSSGYDINGDEYGDILTYTQENNSFFYSLYLGGNPPDTIPAVRVVTSSYNISGDFAMLPDINGDGYDEWGAYWFAGRMPNVDDGYYIFLGSAEPDTIPDLRLVGTPDEIKGSSGNMTGGDFNDDGFGDIVTVQSDSRDRGASEEMMIHFGNRWIAGMDEEHEPEIYLEMTRAYGGAYNFESGNLGCVGDYNGDEIDDFCFGNLYHLVVFAGNRGWRLDAPKETEVPSSFLLSLNSTPNPFNGETTITYSLSHTANVDLTLFDIQGRMLKKLVQGEQITGDHKIAVSDLQSGLYFVLLQSQNQRLIRKIVCLK